MAVRAEVGPDLRIHIMRPQPETGEHMFLEYDTIDDAMRVIKMTLQTDLDQAIKERFVTQIEKDAAKAYKELSEKCPWRKNKK
jgi:hypothetical protein